MIEAVDSMKSLFKRSLILDSFDYEGGKLEVDLQTPQIKFYTISLSQTLDLENDKRQSCLNYPNQKFASFRDCDENFVYNEIKNNYDIMPFWAAKWTDEITHVR